ncbi:MAG: fumarylacetoacetate hydrolase family protein [Alicyclobacillus herbarius]|uniref:2-keto-4-pentenoate hydratase n=1 Tax=Alicyclobacillus herbarius TaxID=122960 RepID=UPI002356F14B|nr:fumarylacetoacetate hydrolase family protein [Alicyclobacillus herbarius]MCL6632549.1 fumarylacetoacetate hydrolase family protein [Alicyclobacillus herbarius]
MAHKDTEVVIESLADLLWDAEQNGRPIAPLTSEYPDLTQEQAYRIQIRNIQRKRTYGDAVVGYKVGLTSRPMQEMLGVHQPDFGHLLHSMYYENGDVVDFPLYQPKVEPELAFVLKADLDGQNLTVQDVLAATDYVVPAIEVIDSRIADWKIQLADTIADNASSGCFVLGDTATPVTGVNLATVGGILRVDGEVVQTGAGAAVLGHPAQSVAWLANTLAALGTTMRAGDVVLSGAISAAVPVRPGQRVSVSFGRLGTVEATIGEPKQTGLVWMEAKGEGRS